MEEVLRVVVEAVELCEKNVVSDVDVVIVDVSETTVELQVVNDRDELENGAVANVEVEGSRMLIDDS